MPTEPLGRYRLRATMKPLAGQPVNWNARAVIWSGCDRRYWVRRGLVKVCARIPHRTPGWKRRARLWLWSLTDDRDLSTYTTAQRRLRWLLNTQKDVEARRAWAESNRYWKARERRQRREVSG